LGKQNFTNTHFIEFIKTKQSKQDNLNAAQYARQLFAQFADHSCLEYEDSQLEKKYPEFAALMEEYRDGILLFDLMDKEVWSKAVKDSTGLAAFYETHKNNYMWGERADATVYMITKDEDVARVKEMLQTDISDEALLQKLDQDSIRSVRIKTGKFEKGDNNFVDMTKWEPGLSDELKTNVDKGSVFVRIHKIITPEPKALDEARGIITSEYQTELEKQWVKRLREKYPVSVDQKIFEKVKSNY
jgi:peptidyl-prolyl cis-trans isomerase SurA